jgi:hypothetical protein
MTSDQILNHVDSIYNSLPDPVKGALDHAHSLTGGGGSGIGDALKPSAAPAPVAPPPVEVSDSMPSLTTANSAQSPHSASVIAPPPVGGGSSITTAPAPSAAQGELSRLAAPPLASDNPLAHTKADTGRTGIGQIHNPFLRGLATVGDVIASGVFPRFGEFVPGTTAHHELLVNDAANAVGQEQKAAKNAADVAQTEALTNAIPGQTELRNAQAEEAKARADSLAHPKSEGKTVTTADGVFEWNPQTDRYDIRVGDAKDQSAITHFFDKSGNAWVLKHDGTAVPVKGPTGEQIQGQPTGPEDEHPLQNLEQLEKGLESRYQVLHPGTPLPEHFRLPKNATIGDYKRIDSALESTERALGTKAQQDQVNEMRRQTMALADEIGRA